MRPTWGKRATSRPAGVTPHGVAHARRGIRARFATLRAAGASALAAFLVVLGPGLLAGLSDDDPAGITTYSVLGTDHGYRLLWIIPLSTALLVQFHLVAVRIGAATGKGFVGLIRERWGRGWGYLSVVLLLFANFGTICAEYAGVAAAGSLIGVPTWASAPAAGVLITLVVLLGSFHRIERVLLVISSTLGLYIIDGILASPVWSEVAAGSLVPRLPETEAGWVAITASLGTTLAPWGLAFIQSYAVDKRITAETMPWARWDVIIGSILTGVIGLAIAVACAATLHQAGVRIESAGDAAAALRPLAGRFATVLFGAGLLGASLLAATIVPMATAYSIAEGAGEPASLDLDARHFQWFYAAFVGLTVAAVSVVVLPGLPLIPLIYASQVVNAVVLPLHLIALVLLSSDLSIMGTLCSTRRGTVLGWGSVVLVVLCVAAMAWWSSASGAATR
ncbi:MAG: NRAMP family divalent metal transporter [Gemmatimonas sp.]|jgi:Mn2+/Fe2+ NRAMP family transporter|uniref:NRAMP family divalent metal transporter n=1 Tax=Gemmatimonas sp. TaxID=1962908 RepID=UPI00391EFF51|nr:divalent metal cation transporter [Gemmatimonadota bacterium]